MTNPQALYSLTIEVEFMGPMPNGPMNTAAPEATPAQRDVVEAVKHVLEAHGFTVTGVGHGSKREGTYLSDS
jgi:hypothetical protein